MATRQLSVLKSLPLEVFQGVLEQLLDKAGLRELERLRVVCRLFSTDALEFAWRRRFLGNWRYLWSDNSPEALGLVSSYLFRHVLAGGGKPAKTINLSFWLYRIVENLLPGSKREDPKFTEALRLLSRAMSTQSKGNGTILECSNGASPKNVCHTAFAGVCLRAAAYLGVDAMCDAILEAASKFPKPKGEPGAAFRIRT